MATTQDDYQRYMSSIRGKVFSFSEAIEFIKVANSMSTTGPPIRWVNASTGRPVAIGSNS